MNELEKTAERLLSGRQGDALRALANTPEARRLGAAAQSANLESALRSGDTERLRAALQGLLSTPEGRRLAEKLSGLGGGHG